jgi:hypothetical protein
MLPPCLISKFSYKICPSSYRLPQQSPSSSHLIPAGKHKYCCYQQAQSLRARTGGRARVELEETFLPLVKGRWLWLQSRALGGGMANWQSHEKPGHTGTGTQGVREAVVVVPYQESTGVAPWPMAPHARHDQPPAASADPCPPRRHCARSTPPSTASSPFSFSPLPSGTVPRPAAMATALGRRQGRWAGAIPHSLRCFCVADTTGANRGQSPSPVASQSQQN